ncbi:ankyrin repeat-containing protein ITN1-like [Prunus avium]|uniref:Ankyrin repeat-containing protein ITN1-like n=1 Tax=Prunus avium TaxID=42229 RepID=A0A6P5SFP6_PRUAV|nr:ankyrin repeat-containing protein ITN1-like [Prunus avium]
MAATVSLIPNLKLLNHRNYKYWSFRVKVYLLAEDVWDVVEKTTEPPKPEDDEVAFRSWRKNNAKALLAIQTCCGDDTYPIIEGISKAKAAWDALAEELKPSHSEEDIHIQQPQPAPINSDVCVNFEELEDNKRNQRDRISSVTGFFQGVVKNLLKLLGIHDLHEMRLRHDRILQILRLMCDVVKSRNLDSKQTAFLQKAIFRAVKQGQVEFIKEMCKANPSIPLITMDGKDRSIFHYAVKCRQEKVFSLIYGLSEYDRTIILASADESNNSILHAAGSLYANLNHIQGAALQMQRELQWFKAVESIVPPQAIETINYTEKITARELFTKNHKELVKEGEESMKGTATSCTVVGALIVTIMFAASFTVPGGSNQDTGFPILSRKKLFKVFIISDSISLFSSTTSVMIFLGILTSRYAEDDFLRSLPTKMLLGLFTLFLSIATMMIAFSSTLFIMLEGESWVSIPIILLASVPIASFVWMQFPLFLDIFMFTYGRGIFDKKCRAWE